MLVLLRTNLVFDFIFLVGVKVGIVSALSPPSLAMVEGVQVVGPGGVRVPKEQLLCPPEL